MAGQKGRGWQQWQSQQQQPSPPWVQTHGPQNPPWQGQGFTAGGHSQPGGYSHKTAFKIHSMFLWAGKPHVEMSHLFWAGEPLYNAMVGWAGQPFSEDKQYGGSL